MPLVITMKAKESVIITTKSGDTVRIELPNGQTKQQRIMFFAEDNIKIERIPRNFNLKPVRSCVVCFNDKCTCIYSERN